LFDGCKDTYFEHLELIDMVYLVNETASIQKFSEVNDVVCKFGKRCCGDRKYELLDPEIHALYLTFYPFRRYF